MKVSHILSRHPEEAARDCARSSRRMAARTEHAAILRGAGATSSRPLLRMTAAALVLASSMVALPARAETVLRVAMTAGDIPDWTGQPDQGFEGYRFVGWSLYDALINWDLSRSDVEAGLTPGLAVKWGIDPANNKRWVFELRKDVKFHD